MGRHVPIDDTENIEWKFDVGDRVQHVKSGNFYVIRDHVLMEKSKEPAYAYSSESWHDCTTWIRDLDEMEDGRFIFAPRIDPETEIASLRAEVARLTAEVESRPRLATLPTEFACGEWIMSGECEPDAVVTYASEPSPETGHVGWCWWARGQMGEASDYMAARAAAERALRAHGEPKR